MAIQQPKIDIRKTTAVQCVQCKNETFMEVTILRKIPKILIAALEDAILPIPAMKCTSCGLLVDEMLPKELRQEAPPTPKIPGITFKS